VVSHFKRLCCTWSADDWKDSQHSEAGYPLTLRKSPRLLRIPVTAYRRHRATMTGCKVPVKLGMVSANALTMYASVNACHHNQRSQLFCTLAADFLWNWAWSLNFFYLWWVNFSRNKPEVTVIMMCRGCKYPNKKGQTVSAKALMMSLYASLFAWHKC